MIRVEVQEVGRSMTMGLYRMVDCLGSWMRPRS